MAKEYLIIQARVAKKVREKLNLEDNWFFVSYSPFTSPRIPIGWLFSDENGNTIELANIRLQYDNSYLKEIPAGWQTICQFYGDIDIFEADTWNWNDFSIKIYPFTIAEMREKQIKSVIDEDKVS